MNSELSFRGLALPVLLAAGLSLAACQKKETPPAPAPMPSTPSMPAPSMPSTSTPSAAMPSTPASAPAAAPGVTGSMPGTGTTTK